MINLPFTLLLLLWMVVSFLSIGVLWRVAKLPRFREIKENEDKATALEQRLAWLEPQVKENALLVAQLEQNRATEEILRTQVEKLELEKQQLEPLGRRVAELEADLNQKHNDLNAAVAGERVLREEIIRLEGTKKAEQEDIENRRRKLEKLNEDAGKLREQYATLQSDIPVAEKTLADLKRRLDSTIDDITRADSKLIELNNECGTAKVNLDAMTEKHSQLKGESQALEKEIAERIKHLEALKADHRNAGGADESEDKLVDLWDGVIKSNEKLSRQSESEDARLKSLSKSMEQRKIVFAPRTLYAFHTAMKSADLSPLTVLAGISGTGKSLLPGVYAEAMGIHFLNLAVQPRWDSPQDMFGFYNYMEQKYKATELARAMVQFERHNLRDGIGALKDQMLMVLLDEMNLARVEYYFSEFLSKLETRRDSKTRQKAEIVLETGHGNGEGEVRLYPDRNILFVGTMNEDESTQNLSDKGKR